MRRRKQRSSIHGKRLTTGKGRRDREDREKEVEEGETAREVGGWGETFTPETKVPKGAFL